MKTLPVWRTALFGVALFVIVAATAGSQITEYRLSAKADPQTDFSKLKTYEWEQGWIAFDRAAHQHFVEAITAELTALGLKEGEPGHADVTVAYYSLRRTDADLNSNILTAEGHLPTYPVGTLIVAIRESGTRRELFTARVDTPIDLEPAHLNAIIDDKVARMFALYPTRRAAQRTSPR